MRREKNLALSVLDPDRRPDQSSLVLVWWVGQLRGVAPGDPVVVGPDLHVEAMLVWALAMVTW